MASLVEGNVSQLSTQASELIVNEELPGAARLYMDKLNCRRMKALLKNWVAPAAHPSFQTVQEHVV